MIDRGHESETSKKQGYSADRIKAMKEKAMQTGARPVSVAGIRAVKCGEYYVGCNTITAHN